MKNVETILSENGIVIPDDVKDAVNKAFAENYKTVAEFQKTKDRLTETEARLKEANDKIAGFDGIDVAAIKQEVADWKKKAEDAEKEFADKIAQRDFDDALAKEINEYKFSSKAAKESVTEKVKKANLTYKDGKILGFTDLMGQIKAEDADAFVEDASSKAKFTDKGTGSKAGGGNITKDEIFAIRDASERQRLIAEHPELFPATN